MFCIVWVNKSSGWMDGWMDGRFGGGDKYGFKDLFQQSKRSNDISYLSASINWPWYKRESSVDTGYSFFAPLPLALTGPGTSK